MTFSPLFDGHRLTDLPSPSGVRTWRPIRPSRPLRRPLHVAGPLVIRQPMSAAAPSSSRRRLLQALAAPAHGALFPQVPTRRGVLCWRRSPLPRLPFLHRHAVATPGGGPSPWSPLPGVWDRTPLMIHEASQTALMSRACGQLIDLLSRQPGSEAAGNVVGRVDLCQAWTCAGRPRAGTTCARRPYRQPKRAPGQEIERRA